MCEAPAQQQQGDISEGLTATSGPSWAEAASQLLLSILPSSIFIPSTAAEGGNQPPLSSLSMSDMCLRNGAQGHKLFLSNILLR